MASTYSGQLRLELQATGENQDTWGTKANTVFSLLEDSIAGLVSVDLTSAGGITLSQANGVVDESRNAVLVFTGAPTSNIAVYVPNVGKNYMIRNNISNSASVRVRVEADAGTALKIPSDFMGLVHTDGTNVFEVARQMNVTSQVSAALRDDLTSIRTELGTVSKTIASSVARLDANNNFAGNVITNYTVSVETTTGAFTFTSADTGKVWVLQNATSMNLNLNKALPVGWNTTLIALGVTVAISAPTSTSLVNTSGHTGLNNYGSGAALMVVKQEGSNSHAWYFFQGETQ